MMRALLLFVALFAGGAVWVACDGDSSAIKENVDAGTGPAPTSSLPGVDGGDGGPGDCFTDPKTHFEIINACTTATKIAKNPTLSKLSPDGGLPPLP